jgi:formyl-CoA transferase/CoA:oxalate CoA-transferase
MILLNGVVAIELGHLLAGPSVTALLRDLGAEIIKIEQPETGDYARNVPHLGPSIWLNYNRGKKSVTLNLKHPKGKEIFYKLVENADVVVENFGPGVAERLGVSYEHLSKINEKLIYCSVKAFPSNSLYRDLPGLDAVAQALGGTMSVTGHPGGEPARIGNSATDLGAGAYGALAIVSALIYRNKTGKGLKIEVSLYDTAVYWNGYWITLYSLTGEVAKPLGSGHPMWCPYKCFLCKDGKWVFIGITSDAHWESFCKVFGLEEVSRDPRFKTNADRVQHRQIVEKIVADVIKSMNRDEVVNKLREAKIPHAPVRTMDEVADDPDLREREIIIQMPTDYGIAKVTMSPITILGQTIGTKSPPPKLGEHNEEVLSKLGYSRKEINEMKKQGII